MNAYLWMWRILHWPFPAGQNVQGLALVQTTKAFACCLRLRTTLGWMTPPSVSPVSQVCICRSGASYHTHCCITSQLRCFKYLLVMYQQDDLNWVIKGAVAGRKGSFLSLFDHFFRLCKVIALVPHPPSVWAWYAIQNQPFFPSVTSTTM